ncbi:MAG: nucleotidyltransferase family protein [Tepidisphaeraceae bacterium]
MSALAAIVLAAGASSRMGRPKQLLTIEGEPLLRRAVRMADQAGCCPIHVVLGCQAHLMMPALAGTAVRTVVNDQWALGMGTSIRCGIEAVLRDVPDVSRVLLMLCDQPRVTAETLQRLDAHQHASQAQVAVAAFEGTIGPPVIVTGDRIAALRYLPDDRGAKALWAEQPQSVLKVDCPEAAIDVDTPAAWEKLLSQPD